MIKNRLRDSVLALSFCSLVAVPVPVYASISDTMDRVLHGMSNVTSPGSYEAAGRGVISGGSISARTKIFNRSVISMTLPEFSAGCGGIDMYGGSFSFINAQQIVQLFRSIASNAIGLLFSIAIDYIDAQLGVNIRKFMEFIQSLNHLLSNSCRLAQGIIADTGIQAALGQKTYNASLKGMVHNVGDAFNRIFETENPIQDATAVASDEENTKDGIYGNLVWIALKKAGGDVFGSSTDTYLEELMNVTGTIITTKPGTGSSVTSADGSSTNTTSTTMNYSVEDPLLELPDFVDGGIVDGSYTTEADIKRCSDKDLCQHLKTAKWKPDHTFKQYIEEQFCGTTAGSCSEGIMAALATNGNSVGMNDDQIKIFNSLPDELKSYLPIIAYRGKDKAGSMGTAGAIIHKMSGAIATELGMRLIQEVVNGVTYSLNTIDAPEKEKFMNKLVEVQKKLHRDYEVYVNHYRPLSEMVEMARVFVDGTANGNMPGAINVNTTYKSK